MNYIKSLILFLVVAVGFTSCSLFSPSHTRCSAYSCNEFDDSLMEDVDRIDTKDFKEAELVY